MKTVLNTDPIGRFALQGYDPVAFHTISEAVKANPYISADYDGYRFLFASEGNKQKFLEDPGKYLPAFGGYCAYGVSLGVYFPVEIKTWEILNGRLHLNFSNDIKEKFHENLEDNLEKAKEHWSGLSEE